jgi:dihydropteridine reductase
MSKSVLVFGSAGAMGRNIFSAFKAKGWNVIGVDLAAAQATNKDFITIPIQGNISVSSNDELLRLMEDISKKQVSEFAAVVNAAGGWAGGGAAGKDIAANTELMWNQSVRSSIACSHIATTLGAPKSSADGTLLVLTSAAATAGPTPGMLAYGTAKAAVNHIVKSVALELAELNSANIAVGVCPVTIDTPGNRAGMPSADFSNWTPCQELSNKIVAWASKSEVRPVNGSLLKVETKAGKTTWSNLF